ncbi:DUF3558 family protein [Actinokineospora iranica]|nr:DUF3558 family protein [Actinokineospora iranica]
MAGGAACSTETPGNPTAEPGPVQPSTASPGSSTTSTPPSSTKTSANGADSPLTEVKPCDLLPESAFGSLGITKSMGEEKIGPARTCSYRVEKASIADSYNLSVALFDKLGLADVVAYGEKKPLKVNSRDSEQSLRGVGGGCAITLAVTAKSRVDVMATGGDGAKLCAPALTAAQLVEPRLP